MSLVSGAGAVAGLVGAYMGRQAQQEAQAAREAQVELLQDQLAIARDKKADYDKAIAAIEQSLEYYQSPEPGHGAHIDERA